MHSEDENKEKMTPKKTKMHGPAAMSAPAEKAKDFKGAIKRLTKELKNYKVLVIISLFLALLSAVISILAPDKLSNLTDTISGGLVINKANLEVLTNEIKSNMSNETMALKMGSLFSENSTISINESDRIFLLNLLKNKDNMDLKNIEIPESLIPVFFSDINVNGNIVSGNSCYKFIKAFMSLDENNSDVTELYKKIDEMPQDIKNVLNPFMDMEKIKNIALILIIMYALSTIFNYTQALCMTNVSNGFARDLRSRISSKINTLPLRYYDKHSNGDILSRVTNDVDLIAQTMNNSLSTLVTSLTLFIGSITMMFITNYIMALTAIIASLIGFSFMGIILKKSQKYFVKKQEELGNLNGHIEEVYSGLLVVKAYNGKYDANKKFDTLNKNLAKCNEKSQFLSGLMPPLMGFIGNFGYLAVCVVGAILTMNDIITFGVIIAFITYVRLFTMPLSQIAQALTSLQSTAAAGERVFEFLDEKDMEKETNIKNIIQKDKVKGNIEFENVVFQYDNNDKPTIKNFSAFAKAGQKIAIVGPTGAGKTTMVNLLMKFYNLTSGDIKIDGISTKDLTRENIHDMFTMVLQDTWLFEGTIKENLRYNNENATDEEIIEVCKKVGLDHFIRTLPNGYDSKITENDSISAGQRQLITIARGMLKNAPFLILDEATSNVDTRTEELVQNAMDKLCSGKTSFIIAHRLSTIKNADLILVMKDGNIVEQGNHEELMKLGGSYAELYNSQFEL